MERRNRMAHQPIKEFYFINNPDGSRKLVSAIGQQGGYIYFLIEANGNLSDKSFSPKISLISNILDYCGSPDTQVVAIEPRDPQHKKLYINLSERIDDYLVSMQSSQMSLE